MNLPVTKTEYIRTQNEKLMSPIVATESFNVNKQQYPVVNKVLVTANTDDFSWFPEAWRFVPIKAGSKAPIGEAWGKNPFTWEQVTPLLGTCHQTSIVGGFGVICGETSGGLLLVDHDGDSCDRLLKEWGVELPETWKFHGSREGHYQLAYWVAPEFWDAIQMFVCKTGSDGPDGKAEQLELRWGAAGEQKQSVCFGTHETTKRKLIWENLHLSEIPHAPLWMIEKMLKPENRVETVKAHKHFDTKVSDYELAKQALNAIIPDHLDWYCWRNCLLAAHDSGLSESDVLEWSKRSSKHTDSGFSDVWRYIKGNASKKVSLGTLIYLAKQDGFTPPRKSLDNSGVSEKPNRKEKLSAKDRAERLKLEVGRIVKITDPFLRAIEEQDLLETYRLAKTKLDGLIRTNVKGGFTESRPPQKLTVAEALHHMPVAQDWLVEEWLPQKTNTLISGLPGTGKSRLTTDLAVSLAMGTPWMGFKTKKSKVLLLNSDQQLHHTARFVNDTGYDLTNPDLQLVGQAEAMAKWTIHRIDVLEEWLDEFQPEIVIIDSIVEAIANPLGLEMKDQQVAAYIGDVQSLCNSKGAGVLWVSHDVKSSEAVGVNRVSGSGFIAGAVDCIWNLEKTQPKNPDCTQRRLSVSKNRQGTPMNAICEMNPENYSFEYKGAPGQSDEQVAQSKLVKEKVLQFLSNAFCSGKLWCRGKEVHEFAGSTNTYTEIGRCLNKGLINATTDPENPRFKIYSVNESLAEQHASPDQWQAYLARKNGGEVVVSVEAVVPVVPTESVIQVVEAPQSAPKTEVFVEAPKPSPSATLAWGLQAVGQWKLGDMAGWVSTTGEGTHEGGITDLSLRFAMLEGLEEPVAIDELFQIKKE